MMSSFAAGTTKKASLDVDIYWTLRCADLEAPKLLSAEDAPYQTEVAHYQVLTFAGSDGYELKARLISPRRIPHAPCVIDFYDGERGPRGWHHLTRWIALGCCVLQPVYRPWPEDLTAGWEGGSDTLVLNQLVEDGVSAVLLAERLPEVKYNRLLLYGEGFGGGIGLSAASIAEMLGTRLKAVSVLNPYPTDADYVWEQDRCEGLYESLTRFFRDQDPRGKQATKLFETLDYADPANLVDNLLTPPVQFGTSEMDTIALPETQDRLAQVIPHCQRITYPKWCHERINDFEDATLEFFQPYCS